MSRQMNKHQAAAGLSFHLSHHLQYLQEGHTSFRHSPRVSHTSSLREVTLPRSTYLSRDQTPRHHPWAHSSTRKGRNRFRPHSKSFHCKHTYCFREQAYSPDNKRPRSSPCICSHKRSLSPDNPQRYQVCRTHRTLCHQSPNDPRGKCNRPP